MHSHGSYRRDFGCILTLVCCVLSTVHGVIQQKLYGLNSGLAYYVQVSVGEPLYDASTASESTNFFNLLVDTGSANTAVVTADCCSSTNSMLYSCSDSSTCVSVGTTVSVDYITGSWSGNLVKDTFSGEGLGELASVPFTEITDESNFIQTGYDGIIGFGYQAIASPSSSPPTPYFDMVKSSNSLSNVFSMLMCGSLQSLALENVSLAEDSYLYSGELIMGGTEGSNGETYYQGDLVYTPLVHEKWYNVIITDIGVSNQSLGLDCQTINSPKSIIDSGTSNIAFPSDVYNAVLKQLKADVSAIYPDVEDDFFSDETSCCSTLCDPTNADSDLYSFPGISISLAVDGDTNEQITVTIPPEYIWRPIVLTYAAGEVACRVFGISEGDMTLLGDVFMDGLFTVHDREQDRVGLAVATSCPNDVVSSKTVTVEKLSAADSMCDCVGSSDKKGSLLSSYWPIGSDKPCFFWLWWTYVVLVSVIVILIAIGVLVYLWWRKRKLLQELRTLRMTQAIARREALEGLERNLLTPMMGDATVTPEETTGARRNHNRRQPPASSQLHQKKKKQLRQQQSIHNADDSTYNSSNSSNSSRGYHPPPSPSSSTIASGHQYRIRADDRV